VRYGSGPGTCNTGTCQHSCRPRRSPSPRRQRGDGGSGDAPYRAKHLGDAKVVSATGGFCHSVAVTENGTATHGNMALMGRTVEKGFLFIFFWVREENEGSKKKRVWTR